MKLDSLTEVLLLVVNNKNVETFPFHPGITILKKINRKKQVSWQ